jgi:multidrug resistance efflux pump
MADADRLQAIQDDYSRALEARITDLMAKVHAARELNEQIADLDNQIEAAEGDAAALEDELAELEAGSDDHVMGTEQVESLREAIDETHGYRAELIESLAKLAGEIGG